MKVERLKSSYICTMENLDVRWNEVMKKLEPDFGDNLDVQSVLFIIGLQELGIIKHRVNKRQKLELMHIAVCRLLSDYGYYEFVGYDNDNWPHYERVKRLPKLNQLEQQKLMKEAIVNYLEKV